MTYCVGMVLDTGLVLMSDTRTNSGVDNISVFRKMFTWNVPGERIITVMTAGNLASTQAVISQLEERMKEPDERDNIILQSPTMFQVASEIGKQTGPQLDPRIDSVALRGYAQGHVMGVEQMGADGIMSDLNRVVGSNHLIGAGPAVTDGEGTR